MSNIKYRKDIDGLRAVAILPVLLFHVGYSGFSGGYVGVDIFFVISEPYTRSFTKAKAKKSFFIKTTSICPARKLKL
ncbi:acyltransferase [Escherichia coli]|uniref:acyltransferase family protein n=1 Tax=Escherichia coli TaxID=562 RepID=UPI001788701F|nr:acyltransferase [Escherichia coli]MBE1042691.1 acyltransferase [Escherichia coli]